MQAIEAYDALGEKYAEIAARRRLYLDAIDELVVERAQRHAASLLDVGAGDGRRALKIAGRIGIERLVLLEPSSGMRKVIPRANEVWAERLEEVERPDTFDIILCLWNVLGHLGAEADCARGLQKVHQLCCRKGVVFLDVVNRHNVEACGVGVVMRRMIRDLVSPAWSNGEVDVTWRVGHDEIRTRGHVFRDKEMRQLFACTGFEVAERIVLGYGDGEVKRSQLSGNLFYVLRKR
jgi:SAM-dependent methyltransferase